MRDDEPETTYVLVLGGQAIECTYEEAQGLRDVLVKWLGPPDKQPLPQWIPTTSGTS